MVDVARLAIEVDTTDLNRATTTLRRFQQQGARTENAAGKIGRSMRRSSGGVRNFSLQMSQVVQQASAGGNALQAFALQLPDLVLGLGPVGIALGAVAGGALSYTLVMRNAKEETADWKKEMDAINPTLGGIRSTIDQLTGVARAYNSVIGQSGGTASTAASIIAASSEREFNARKQVLQVEREILGIRQEEQRTELRNLRDQQQLRRIAAQVDIPDFSAGPNFPGLEGIIRTRPNSIAEALANQDVPELVREARQLKDALDGDTVFQERARRIRLLRAELELSGLAGEEADRILDKTFEDVAIAAGKAETGVKGVTPELKKMGQVGATAVDSLVDAFADWTVRGFRDFQGFTKSVLGQFQDMLARMIATAARNRIIIGVGLGGAAGTPAAASSVLTDTLLGGVTSGIGSGLGEALGGVLSGGGLGSIFNVGANAAAAAGGTATIATTIGAALPVLGLGLALFGLFKRKPPISAEDFRAIQTGLSLTGQELFDTGKAGQRAAADLKNIAGGVDEFRSKTQTYFDLFFTESEKRQRAEEGLAATFARLSIEAPRTNREFRDIVEGLDLTTRQGREAYDALLDISPAFAAITNEATSLDQALARLTGRQGIFATLQDQVFVSAQLAQGNTQDFASLKAELGEIKNVIRAGNITNSRNTIETNNILTRQELAPQVAS